MTAFLAGAAAGAAAAGLLVRWIYAGSQRRLGRFFSFAAHEISSPATAINMTAFNFVSGIYGELSAEEKPWFDLLREQSVRLSAITGELRDLIELEISRDLKVQISEFSAEAGLRRAIEAVSRGFKQAGADIRVSIEPKVPVIKGDEDRFFRTLVSLFHYALKFRAKGDLLVSLKRAGGHKAEVVLEFGCPPMTRSEVKANLDLYYPARDLTGGKAKTTGLGLGLLRKLARLQGGDVLFAMDGTTEQAALRLLAPLGGA